MKEEVKTFQGIFKQIQNEIPVDQQHQLLQVRLARVKNEVWFSSTKKEIGP